MTKEEQILSATLRDRCRQAENRGLPTHTGFLSPAELALAESFCIAEKARFVLDGGYEDAERRICIFLPRDFDAEERLAPDLLCILKVGAPKGSRELTHRDYLGAILGLGVDRSVVGDILVRKDGADIIVLREMAGYLAQNFCSAGRASVGVEIAELSELDAGEQRTEEFRDTVASLRLDSIAAGAFRMARGKAQEAIRMGLVSVNGRQVLKPDSEVDEGDRISFRGKGKTVLTEVGGRTRKDRISVVFTRFL